MRRLTRPRWARDATGAAGAVFPSEPVQREKAVHNKFAIGAVIAALAAATGCKSDSEQVCDKLSDLAANAGDDDQLVKKAAEQFKDTQKCVAEVDKLQKEDPEVFAEAKTCIMDASKIDDAVGCMFKAALDKKSKKS